MVPTFGMDAVCPAEKVPDTPATVKLVRVNVAAGLPEPVSLVKTFPVTGVSSKIMTGQPIRGGTTFSQVLLDEAALMRLQKGLPPIVDDVNEDIDELDDEDIAEELAVASDDKCNTVRLRMNTVMPEADVDLEEPDIEFNVIDAE